MLCFFIFLIRTRHDGTANKLYYFLLQVDCIFGILDAVGSDLERDIPDMIQQLYVSMRDVVLTRDCSIPVKKTLLHLIELRAFKWVLPQSTSNYYNALKLNDA